MPPRRIGLAGNAMGQRGQPHLEPEDIEEIGADGRIETVAGIVDIDAHPFGRIFQRRKMIGVFLKEIGNGVGGEVIGLCLPVPARRFTP